MPWGKRLNGELEEASEKALTEFMDEHGVQEPVRTFFLDLRRVDRAAYKRFGRRLLMGMVIAIAFATAAIAIAAIRTQDAIDAVGQGRGDNIVTSCELRQQGNNVLLAVIDFAVAPQNRDPRQGPPTKREQDLITAFTTLVDPIRPDAQQKACQKILDTAGIDRQAPILPGPPPPPKIPPSQGAK